MAIVEIAHNPELTHQDVQRIFREHFKFPYKVMVPGWVRRIFPPRNFAVSKTEWTSVGIRLKQQELKTSIIFTALPPPAGIHSFIYNLIPLLSWIILRPGRKELEKEVKVFIENAVAFQSQVGQSQIERSQTVQRSKLKLAVITAVILTGLGFGMFLFGTRGNDLEQLEQSGFKDCVECDLSEVRLFGENLSKADLTEADLTNADLTIATLTGALLRGAKLTGAKLMAAKLGSADLSGASLFGADLTGVNLAEADLREADLRGAKLMAAKMTGADLTGANLSHPRIKGMSGANLTDANLAGANLTEADLSGANLSGAILDGVIDADFTGAVNVPAKYRKD
jgi:uncharacterized protein YjbI with pentapeptide repeats